MSFKSNNTHTTCFTLCLWKESSRIVTLTQPIKAGSEWSCPQADFVARWATTGEVTASWTVSGGGSNKSLVYSVRNWLISIRSVVGLWSFLGRKKKVFLLLAFEFTHVSIERREIPFFCSSFFSVLRLFTPFIRGFISPLFFTIDFLQSLACHFEDTRDHFSGLFWSSHSSPRQKTSSCTLYMNNLLTSDRPLCCFFSASVYASACFLTFLEWLWKVRHQSNSSTEEDTYQASLVHKKKSSRLSEKSGMSLGRTSFPESNSVFAHHFHHWSHWKSFPNLLELSK